MLLLDEAAPLRHPSHERTDVVLRRSRYTRHEAAVSVTAASFAGRGLGCTEVLLGRSAAPPSSRRLPSGPGCHSALSRAAPAATWDRRGRGGAVAVSIPLAFGEAAKGDQADQSDDQSDPEAPAEHQDDADDDQHPTEADAAGVAACPFSCHVVLPARVRRGRGALIPACHLFAPARRCPLLRMRDESASL